MSYPQPFPGDEATTPYGAAPMLVKLAGIFLLIAAGLDLLYGILMAVLAILLGTGVIPRSIFDDKMMGPGMVGGGARAVPPILLFVTIAGIYALLSLSVASVKLIGGMKLVRLRKGAWGWGLAAGIVSCVQIWCSLGCVLPMGAGVYTIVILCLENVRRYLRDSAPS